MSTKEASTQAHETSHNVAKEAKTAPHDIMLLFLRRAAEGISDKANESTIIAQWETPITVIVHGVAMAGTLISRQKYMDEIAKDLKGAVLATADNTTKKAWGIMTDAIKDIPSEIKQRGDYVYLANTRILSPTGSMMAGALWCIRLADISAFMLGHPTDV